jgi:DivIVA domain-containing protein
MSASELERLVPTEIRNVSFPASVRGYDRAAVDAYVKRVNRAIAELEVGRSPHAAVRHALEQLREQTSGILQRARETADEITAKARQEAEASSAREKAEAAAFVVNASAEADAERAEAAEVAAKASAEAERILAHSRAEAEEILTRSRAEAAERLQRSDEEAAALRERAEARKRALQADIQAIGEQQRALLDDIRGTAARLEQMAGEAAARFPAGKPAEPAEQGTRAPEAEAEAEQTEIAATDAPRPAMSAGRAHARGDDRPADEEPK